MQFYHKKRIKNRHFILDFIKCFEVLGGCSIYELIYMKADYEPWWQFDDWELNIVFSKQFENKEKLTNQLSELLNEFRKKYPHEESRDSMYYAFWSEDEKSFCDACDDDNQIYHGIIVRKIEHN